MSPKREALMDGRQKMMVNREDVAVGWLKRHS